MDFPSLAGLSILCSGPQAYRLTRIRLSMMQNMLVWVDEEISKGLEIDLPRDPGGTPGIRRGTADGHRFQLNRRRLRMAMCRLTNMAGWFPETQIQKSRCCV